MNEWFAIHVQFIWMKELVRSRSWKWTELPKPSFHHKIDIKKRNNLRKKKYLKASINCDVVFCCCCCNYHFQQNVKGFDDFFYWTCAVLRKFFVQLFILKHTKKGHNTTKRLPVSERALFQAVTIHIHTWTYMYSVTWAHQRCQRRRQISVFLLWLANKTHS